MSENKIKNQNIIDKNKNKKVREFIHLILMIAFVYLISWGVSRYVWTPVEVEGGSMEPTLQAEDTLFLNRTKREFDRGDVIVFEASKNVPHASDDISYIKRVIGLPGDTVKKEGENLYVNDRLVNQEYLRDGFGIVPNQQRGDEYARIDGDYESTEGSAVGFQKDWTLSTLSQNNIGWNDFSKNQSEVPEGTYFVMGDHRSVSRDSRDFGFVHEDTVQGLVYSNRFVKGYINGLFMSEELENIIEEYDYFVNEFSDNFFADTE